MGWGAGEPEPDRNRDTEMGKGVEVYHLQESERGAGQQCSGWIRVLQLVDTEQRRVRLGALVKGL